MSFREKEITCKCGKTFSINRAKDWCPNCGKEVFYDETSEFKNKMNNMYIYGIIGSVIFLITWIFLEFIAKPFLGR